ncbi:MAG: hypothetical protein HC875_00430 [Anaerolineales bacterium]|nr:hypothetical protein [Anaerolineales bacterium]
MSTFSLLTYNLKSLFLAILLFIFFSLLACSSPTDNLSLEAQMREYFYRHQPTTGSQFVEWASSNLTDYSPQQVYTALHDEGKFQAELGHPNVVGVLSFASRSWAEQYDLQYNPDKWLQLQKEAKLNLNEKSKEVQLWPKE